ncbi:30S ribosomal protein S6 [Botrimarina colliarenosi]|uniref:Small ribosomal subunit protein bS6 n=1 Tax=Botrimarina colliarenosi TaxID=2528001 RepID=A0A5C6A7C3_9BACT|nr:30S ribosomal protein S6 [Botrimarina colliarenosi]TWT95336.1 30S ribosomal protein S6 [Botrimarina colliarenosi]
MAQNVYEGLFIFDANKFARDHDALPKAVEEMITSEGGEVVVSRLWEERRLAYAVKGQRKGAYWLIYFRQDGDKITGLNRACELKSGVLRHMVLKIHPRLVEPILEHATAAPIHEGEGEGEGAATAESAPAPAEATAAE